MFQNLTEHYLLKKCGPLREKTGHQFWPSKTQSCLLCYRDQLEYCYFACSKFVNYTFQRVSGSQINVRTWNYMLWVLKRTVSMRRFFWASKTNLFRLLGKKLIAILRRIFFAYLDLWVYINALIGLHGSAGWVGLRLCCSHVSTLNATKSGFLAPRPIYLLCCFFKSFTFLPFQQEMFLN